MILAIEEFEQREQIEAEKRFHCTCGGVPDPFPDGGFTICSGCHDRNQFRSGIYFALQQAENRRQREIEAARFNQKGRELEELKSELLARLELREVKHASVEVEASQEYAAFDITIQCKIGYHTIYKQSIQEIADSILGKYL